MTKRFISFCKLYSTRKYKEKRVFLCRFTRLQYLFKKKTEICMTVRFL